MRSLFYFCLLQVLPLPLFSFGWLFPAGGRDFHFEEEWWRETESGEGKREEMERELFDDCFFPTSFSFNDQGGRSPQRSPPRTSP